MNNIKIFYGPKRKFKDMIEFDYNIMTLTELVTKSDSTRREFKIVTDRDSDNIESEERQHIETLICYSEEYSGITDSAIHNFLSFLSGYEIDNLYLQNPPSHIVEQFQNAHLPIEIIKHTYSRISKEMLKEINAEFNTIIIGQHRVKDKLLSALYPSCKEDEDSPIVMLFYGPSGVGKTETAKYLSEKLKENLFRKQFSMFHNEEFSSYIFGGKHTQHSLSKDLLERQSNVILFDEFDKPHPVFHSAFYQMFDEGEFHDKNYHVTLKNSIIICTSNYNNESEIKKHLGAPIYSRFDSVIKFDELKPSDIEKIIAKEYNLILSKLNKHEIEIIKKSNVYNRALSTIIKFSNVREARRILKEAISYILVKNFIQ